MGLHQRIRIATPAGTVMSDKAKGAMAFPNRMLPGKIGSITASAGAQSTAEVFLERASARPESAKGQMTRPMTKDRALWATATPTAGASSAAVACHRVG